MYKKKREGDFSFAPLQFLTLFIFVGYLYGGKFLTYIHNHLLKLKAKTQKLCLNVLVLTVKMRCKICKIVVGHAHPKTRLRRVCGKCIYSIKKLLNMWSINDNNE